jgi:hypothetical protein
LLIRPGDLPSLLPLEPPSGTTFPPITKEGDTGWSLAVKVGM